MIYRALPQALALVSAMRPDWDPAETSRAVDACVWAGWPWTRFVTRLVSTAATDAGEPRDLADEAIASAYATGDPDLHRRGPGYPVTPETVAAVAATRSRVASAAQASRVARHHPGALGGGADTGDESADARPVIERRHASAQ